MSIIHMFLAAVLLLGPLIALHEFGHFWVARRMGIKVLVYSIGFGPVIWKRIAKDGVQYQLAAIPLGGYVRMVDEREGNVPEEHLPYAFNRQSAWARMAVVAAGPMMNLLCAIAIYWVLLMQPSIEPNTRIGVIIPDSPAAQVGLQAGDRIIAIDGKPLSNWDNLRYAVIARMGDNGTIAVNAVHHQMPQTFNIPIAHFLGKGQQGDPLEQLGFLPWQPHMAPVIGNIAKDSAADRQGLNVNDEVLKINGQPVNDWLAMTRIIRKFPEQLIELTVLRQGQTQTLRIMPQGHRDTMGAVQGYLGIGPKVPPQAAFELPADYRQVVQYNPAMALVKACEKTWDTSVMTVKSFGKMLRGLISLDNLSGPITIAKVADQTANIGWQAFLSFMAVMSISLGVLNLMPIPVLDGGHLLYYFIEAVRGRPVSEQVQEFGLKIGLALLGMMMVVALFNDFNRLM